MLISIGDLTLKVRSSEKQYVCKILKLIPDEGKAIKAKNAPERPGSKNRGNFRCAISA